MKPYFKSKTFRLYQGDCLEVLPKLPSESVQCCVTSPPYFRLRDYEGENGQLGLEKTVDAYVQNMVKVFREVRRVLKESGTLWLNLGESWKNKQVQGIPWKTAFALQDDGWILRQDIIWHKKNPLPSSVKDRFVTAHEYIFLLAKSPKYYFDYEKVREVAAGTHIGTTLRYKRYGQGDGKSTLDSGTFDVRTKRDVWTVITGTDRRDSDGEHFAAYPVRLIRPCIEAGCPKESCKNCGRGWLGGKPVCDCRFYRLRNDVPEAIKKELIELGIA